MEKILSSEERLRLIALAQKDLHGKTSKESQDALNALYESVIPAIKDAMRRFGGLMYKNIDPQCYYDACSDGAINALLTYKPERGIQFSTYLFNQMRFAILKLNRENKLRPQIGVGSYFTTSIYDTATNVSFAENPLTIEETLIDPEYLEQQSILNSEILLNKLTNLMGKRNIEYIYLSEIKHKTDAEIASMYGSKRSTVSMTIKTSRDKIRKLFYYANEIKRLQTEGLSDTEIEKTLSIAHRHLNYYRNFYDYFYNDGKMPEPELDKQKREMVQLLNKYEPVFLYSNLFLYNKLKFVDKHQRKELDNFAKNSDITSQSNLDIILKCRIRKMVDNAELVYKVKKGLPHHIELLPIIFKTDYKTIKFYLDFYEFSVNEKPDYIPNPLMASEILDNKVVKFSFYNVSSKYKQAKNRKEEYENDK